MLGPMKPTQLLPSIPKSPGSTPSIFTSVTLTPASLEFFSAIFALLAAPTVVVGKAVEPGTVREPELGSAAAAGPAAKQAAATSAATMRTRRRNGTGFLFIAPDRHAHA